MQTLWAEKALIAGSWCTNVRVDIGENGCIAAIETGAKRQGMPVGILLPAAVNLHSHAFQRAMAGLTEARGQDPSDSFWTWRQLMYRFLGRLTPDDVESIAAFVQMEMLEAGYAAVAEFHYLHHSPGGMPHDDIAEMAKRIMSAAELSGIGLTLLPVLYEQANSSGEPLEAGQIRFGNDIDRFTRLVDACRAPMTRAPVDWVLGIAPHSLRAVSPESLEAAASLIPGAPLHMHIAEQTGEVEEIEAAFGKRPVEWLFANHGVDRRWCLIHCTHLSAQETQMLAESGAVAGLCPITESSLGDGIFNGKAYLEAGGRIGIGSDSNIRITLAEELRTLEYSQRLRDRARAVLATQDRSTGRVLYDAVVTGGAQAAGRNSGGIEEGRLADLVALNAGTVDLQGRNGDTILDTFIFAGDSSWVQAVWSAGRPVVRNGSHIHRERIAGRYRETMRRLGQAI